MVSSAHGQPRQGRLPLRLALYLASALRVVEAMPQGSFGQVVEKYVEMNVAHPFREGNGTYHMHLARPHLQARTRAHNRLVDHSARGLPARDGALPRLRHRVDDFVLPSRGIDASYAYEDYAALRTEELVL